MNVPKLGTIVLILGTIVCFSHTSSAKVIELETKEQIKAELAKPGPMVLLYGAEWCGPCHAFRPKYEEISEQMKDVRFYRMDSDIVRLKEHEKIFKYIPAAYVGRDEEELRKRPCEILNGERDVESVKKEIRRCLRRKK